MSPRAFSQEEKERVRGRLVAAAQEFLSTTGIKKTSVEELSRAAGISKGAFYLFYESKEDLFLDALEEEQTRIHEAIIRGVGEQEDKKTGFVEVIARMYEEFIAKPWLVMLSVEEYEILARRLPQERIAEHIRQDDALMRRLVTALGKNINVEPQLLSAVMRMLFLGILNRKEIGPYTDDAFRYALSALADKLFSEGTQ